MSVRKKEQDVQAVVQVPGDHTMVVPKGTEALIEDLFSAAGLKGKFVLYLGEHIKGTAHMQGISVRSLFNGRVIKLRVQPGDNTTSHFVNYTVPESANPEEIMRQLKAGEVQLANPSQKKTRLEKKMRRLFRLLNGRDIVLAELREDTYREVGFASVEDLLAVLRGMARNSFFITAAGEGMYIWTADMRRKMSQLGFEMEDADNRDSIPTEEEGEEDKILRRILEIDDELEAVAAEVTAAETEVGEAKQISKEKGDAMAVLMKQVESMGAAVETANRKETELIFKRDDLLAQHTSLEQERKDLDTRLGEIDQAQKISRARLNVEKLLIGLKPEERDVLLSQLAGGGVAV